MRALYLTLLAFMVQISGVFVLPPPLLGGWDKVTVLDSPFIKSVAEKALELVQARNVGGKALTLSKIVDAYNQILSGANFRLVVQVNMLNCTIAEVSEYRPEACVVATTGLYFLELHTQPWTLTYNLTYQFCSGFVPVLTSEPVNLLNSWLTLDPTDPVAVGYASTSVGLYDGNYKLESLSGGSFRNTYNLNITFVEYKFNLKAVSNRCKGDGSLANCELSCTLVLKVELWTNSVKLTYQECKNSSPGVDPTPVVGGWFPIDPLSAEGREISKEAVKAYQSRRVKKILAYNVLSISAKVVAGMHYKVNLQIIECLKDEVGICDEMQFHSCQFEVNKRSWTFELKDICFLLTL